MRCLASRAAEAVWTGGHDHAFNAAGGLHHAMPARASGFCVYDDPAVAIAWLLDRVPSGSPTSTSTSTTATGRRRSSGTTRACSRSRSTSTARCSSRARGARPSAAVRRAPGSAINVPLPPGTGDAGWLERVPTRWCPAPSRAFGPDVLVTQLGCDTHHTDPLAHAPAHDGAYREAARTVHDAGARRRRRTMGRDRRRRLPVGAGRPARVDALVRRDGRRRRRSRRRPPGARGSSARRIDARRPGPDHVLRTAARSLAGRRRGASGRRRRSLPCWAADGTHQARSARSVRPARRRSWSRGSSRAGASVFRLNFSHGTPEDHARDGRARP